MFHEKLGWAKCGHLGEAIMVDGRRVEPKECLDCFAARHEKNGSIGPEMLQALAILGNLMHEVVAGDENSP